MGYQELLIECEMRGFQYSDSQRLYTRRPLHICVDSAIPRGRVLDPEFLNEELAKIGLLYEKETANPNFETINFEYSTDVFHQRNISLAGLPTVQMTQLIIPEHPDGFYTHTEQAFKFAQDVLEVAIPIFEDPRNYKF